jgi:EAL domain-containing protein (putative c-di-GMP-specific phosphodiesterase class I)
VAGRAHVCTASIGIAMFGGPLGPVDDLLRRADSAMYAAKAAGKNTYRFFDERLQREMDEKANLESDLRLAIERGQLNLVYQPKVDRQGHVCSVEALCRWRHPQRGEVPPSLFIPLAEGCGLIYPLGMWILQRALEDLRQWCQNPVTRALGVAVNVSARQFHHPDFVEEVKAAIRASAVDPRLLTLELTESVVSQDVGSIVQTMHQMGQQGVRFSLDDFGTGYSSLSYLRCLPLNEVKIDRSFVLNVAENPADESVVHTVVALAKSLNFSVVAEGVETPAQHHILAAAGCDLFQGYLFFKPMPAAELAAAVARPPLES